MYLISERIHIKIIKYKLRIQTKTFMIKQLLIVTISKQTFQGAFILRFCKDYKISHKHLNQSM